MTKLSLSQIEDSYRVDVDISDWTCDESIADEEFPVRIDHEEIDESCYRNTYQRKEIRTKRKREDGEVVGSGDIRKHRKF